MASSNAFINSGLSYNRFGMNCGCSAESIGTPCACVYCAEKDRSNSVVERSGCGLQYPLFPYPRKNGDNPVDTVGHRTPCSLSVTVAGVTSHPDAFCTNCENINGGYRARYIGGHSDASTDSACIWNFGICSDSKLNINCGNTWHGDDNVIELRHLSDDGWVPGSTGYRDLYLIATAMVQPNCGNGTYKNLLFCKQKKVGRTEYTLTGECNSNVDCTTWNGLVLDEDSNQIASQPNEFPVYIGTRSENCLGSGATVTISALDNRTAWEDYFNCHAYRVEGQLTPSGTTSYTSLGGGCNAFAHNANVGQREVIGQLFTEETHTGPFNQGFKVHSFPGAVKVTVAGVDNNPDISGLCNNCDDINGEHILTNGILSTSSNGVAMPNYTASWSKVLFNNHTDTVDETDTAICCQPANYCGPPTGFLCGAGLTFTISSGIGTGHVATVNVAGLISASQNISIPIDGRTFNLNYPGVGIQSSANYWCRGTGLTVSVEAYTPTVNRRESPCLDSRTAPCNVFKNNTPPTAFMVDIPSAWTEWNRYDTTGSGGPYIPSCLQRGDPVVKPGGAYVLDRIGGASVGNNSQLEYDASNGCPTAFAWNNPPAWAEGCVYGYVNPVTSSPCYDEMIRDDCLTGPQNSNCGQGTVNTCGWHYMTLSVSRYSQDGTFSVPCSPPFPGGGVNCADTTWAGVFAISLTINQVGRVPGGMCFESITDDWNSSYRFMALISGSHPAIKRSEDYYYIDPALLGDVELWYAGGFVSNQSIQWDNAPIDVSGPCGYDGCYNPDTGKTCGYYNCYAWEGSVCKCMAFVNPDLSPSSPYAKITVSVV